MKLLKINEQIKESLLEQFAKALNNYNGETTFKYTLATESVEKPNVYMTADAYLKMITIVQNSADEIAWHGTVEKINNSYLITDIFVYPQTVTAATVDSDEEKYVQWLMQLPDETINKMKFQGHSHVNMAVGPSGRDTTNWEHFTNMLKQDEFYIFCITNKRNEFYWQIVDLEKNILFENKDITFIVTDSKGNDLKTWCTDTIKSNITKEKPLSKTYYKQTKLLGLEDEPVAHKYKPFSNLIADNHWTVDYIEETDMYVSDVFVQGFIYDKLYDAFIMRGDNYRAHYLSGKKGKGKKEVKNK